MPTGPTFQSNALFAPGIYVDEVEPGVSDLPALTREIARTALDDICQRELAWLVFEQNQPKTWTQLVQNLRGSLVRLWITAALQGRNVHEAFFIRCDLTTMTPDDLRDGRLICLVGVAPVRPSEFVTFRILIRFAPRP